MTEQNTTPTQNKPVQRSQADLILNVFLILVIAAGVIYLVMQHPAMIWKILLVLLGFGAVVMIHELGHFLMAKLCGIKIEMFSIGFPPILLGIRKTKKGFRFRLLPQSGAVETLEEGDSDTEYCIGAVPFGGFVKMLGQSDSGPVEKSDDPRSFLNKPIWQRIVVVAGGVAFNAIGAMILFMALFLHGLELMPAVVGNVIPGSPADVAGLKAGDRIVEIDGEKFIDFTTVILSAALSDKDRGVKMKIDRAGSPEFETQLVAAKLVNDTSGIRAFGIIQPTTLTISPDIKDPEEVDELCKQMGFRPGDVITAINGKPISKVWQFDSHVATTLNSKVVFTVSRSYPAGSPAATAEIELPLLCDPLLHNFQNEFDLAHIYSMVPRLRVWDVLYETGQDGLQEGDIIIKVADVENPTYKDLRDKTTAFKDKILDMVVLRKNAEGKDVAETLKLQPKARPGDNGRATLGIRVELEMDHAVVAQTIYSSTGPSALGIPSGAVVTSVDGQPVQSFYDVIGLIRKNSGQHISIEYRLGQDGGGTGLDVPEQDVMHISSTLRSANVIPLQMLRETFKASNPGTAIVWGVKRTKQYVMQSVMTLIGLFTKTVPASSLSGPVGIASISYRMAGQGILDLLNFLGLVSSCLVVMNLLPLPIVDGGLIVLLIVEKIRGVPLAQKAQEIITWIGLILLLSVFLWVTYNDILRWILPGR
ncbi:MAG: site-2 protease family protein [Anaerohalosphaeraceae bacterium]